jgi:hypothetical protein
MGGVAEGVEELRAERLERRGAEVRCLYRLEVSGGQVRGRAVRVLV